MGAPVEMIGLRFGRLIVIARGPDYESNGKKTRRWFCRCDCGAEVLTFGNGLRSGHAKSCGCLRQEAIALAATVHGMAGTGTYSSWLAMWSRCTSETNVSYPNYGGRGVSVCDRWKSFSNFLADMGERPEGMTLDRKEVMGNYTPENCSWATKEEQDNNKRTCVYVTVGDRTQTYAQWGRELGISANAVRRRYLKFGSIDQPRRHGNLKRNSNGQYE